MTDFEDEDLETTIRKALASDPKLAERCVVLMTQGCREIERFEEAVATIRKANTYTTVVNLALDECLDAFSTMINIYSELMNIATGQARQE